jgi:hypothetical protein
MPKSAVIKLAVAFMTNKVIALLKIASRIHVRTGATALSSSVAPSLLIATRARNVRSMTHFPLAAQKTETEETAEIDVVEMTKTMSIAAETVVVDEVTTMSRPAIKIDAADMDEMTETTAMTRTDATDVDEMIATWKMMKTDETAVDETVATIATWKMRKIAAAATDEITVIWKMMKTAAAVMDETIATWKMRV